jgi:hypothetical protein
MNSKPQDINLMVTLDEVDGEIQRRALDCYVAYQATIEEVGLGGVSRGKQCSRPIRKRTSRRLKAH